MANEQSNGRALTAIDEVRNAIDRMGPQFKMVLPPHIPVERFVRVVQTAIVSNPDLLECSRQTLYGAAMRCATDGLLPDGQEAAITKFGQVAQYMPMVKGILKKVRNSGELTTINAHVVRENDKYRSWVDEKGEHFEHEKARKDRGAPIYTYAYAITKDGGFYFEELTEEDVQAIRNVSRAAKNGPWAGVFADEMRRKSAIRRLSKRLPMSTDVEKTLQADDELFDPPTAGEHTQGAATADVVDTPAPAATKRPRALSKVIDQSRQGQDGPTDVDPATGKVIDEDVASGPPAGHPANGAPDDVI